MHCQFCNKECKNNNSLKNHERTCPQNPNRNYKNGMTGKCAWNKGLTKETDERVKHYGETLKQHYKEGKITNFHKQTEETKKKISESMKLAHKEGRAHNIGECRHNNEPSYPEKWFMRVIENEFSNKNYIREFPFYRYFLDFAWPDLKICIEIDGEQHERFEEYKERDIKKDELLKQEGWKELRISWKECCKNPKYYISLAKQLFE